MLAGLYLRILLRVDECKSVCGFENSLSFSPYVTFSLYYILKSASIACFMFIWMFSLSFF